MHIRQIVLSCTLFLLPVLSNACGYAYVSTCAHRIDFLVNSSQQPFHVGVCTWMTEFQDHQFGTPTTLKITKANNITWESCTNRVLNATMYYRIYLTGSAPGAFNALALTELNYSTNGAYGNREYYKNPNLDLLSGLAGGNYTLELYYRSDIDFNNDNVPDTQLTRNNNGANYKAYFTKTGPPPACSITAAVSAITCLDNGTPNNASDDQFTCSLTATGSATGTGWHTVINGQNITGNYNTPVSLGPYPISGGSLAFTVTDNTSSSCTTAVSVSPPATCSNGGTACSKNVLVIVGNGNAPVAADMAIINRLTASLAATVTIKDDAVANAADAAGKNLVIITATVNATQVNTKFRDVAVPVIVWKKDLFDDMQLIGTASGQSGSTNNISNGTIALPAHPLAAGLSGNTALFSSPSSVYWGIPLASANKIVRITNSKYLVFAYESGVALTAMNAPAKRIAFFLHTTFTNNLTTNGWALFDAAVNWSTGCPTAPFAPVQEENNIAALSVAAGTSVDPETTAAFQAPTTVRVYPNPVAGDQVYAEYAPLEVASEVMVVNLLGQIVARAPRAAAAINPVEINTAHLPAGVYYLLVQGVGIAHPLTGSFMVQE